ncbi:MAG: type II toxin-antitoxin system RelE/ParE family toxin [Candidatus Freyarchaeota archaeon]|nr:type II toxin-antitoxin system RelE/ParE family toxin [Candidatus Jordarchaeia archaeon]MBS7269697.1 type II toxin-antitoxin system RelE/ParE family toxin [Candidatus Jordarchaeia archaeon]MBS7281216.1 type II toxin-antitoxin system RelE/ParE family toxin [Candidatus Jordarchaeia archaeon]
MQRRIAAKLKDYAREPLRYAKKLISPKVGAYRFRIGDYRVVFDIEGEDIVILRVGHRKSIYK